MNNQPSIFLAKKAKIKNPQFALTFALMVVLDVCHLTNTNAEIITVAEPGALAFSIGKNRQNIAPFMLQNFRDCLGGCFEVEMYDKPVGIVFTIVNIS
jgi:hypothetical protein